MKGPGNLNIQDDKSSESVKEDLEYIFDIICEVF